jgi:1-acyl-sn-glycerol-3-phosphate acyltransferase
MTIRAAGRICWFAWELAIVVINYFFTAALAPAKSRRLARAAWLHRAARRHLKIFHCAIDVAGTVPQRGLLVSNHLSYFDILVLSAVTPAVFVSKAEVRRWPLFGWLAARAGTVFIERERRAHVGAVNREIESALNAGALVVIFPEGTSTNGEEVLPFRSPLLEPVIHTAREITVSHLRYELADGDARAEVCYWGDHVFFPHLLHLLGKKQVRATVRFEKFSRATRDRKELAKQLHAAVLKLKDNGAPAGFIERQSGKTGSRRW